MSNGLLSNSINAIVEDFDGNIWVGSNKGVNKIDTSFKVVNGINFSDSVHENEFNQSAALLSKRGRLYFGGLNGVSAFSPDIEHINQKQPEVKLKKIAIGNNEVVLNQPAHSLPKIEFGHRDYLITFEFIAIDYAQPEKNQYQYKLDGFDPNWINLGNTNRATFTNLPSGNFILKVKASNSDGVWSDEQVNLLVKVNPAPWKTWWAYSLYTALFCFALIYFIRYQARRLASQDVFHERVNQLVNEKTQLYIKSNDLLSQKVDYLKNLSLVDEETQLCSPTAFVEQGNLALRWLDLLQQESNNSDYKLYVFVLAIEMVQEPSENLSNVITKVTNAINGQFDVVARWDKLTISGFVLQRAETNPAKLSCSVIQQIRNNMGSNTNRYKLSLGYTTPLYEQSIQQIDFDSIMLLSEHFAHFALGQAQDAYAGIDKMYQPLNKTVLKQSLAAREIDDLDNLYAITLAVVE
jgi:hypothetical protein